MPLTRLCGMQRRVLIAKSHRGSPPLLHSKRARRREESIAGLADPEHDSLEKLPPSHLAHTRSSAHACPSTRPASSNRRMNTATTRVEVRSTSPDWVPRVFGCSRHVLRDYRPGTARAVTDPGILLGCQTTRNRSGFSGFARLRSSGPARSTSRSAGTTFRSCSESATSSSIRPVTKRRPLLSSCRPRTLGGVPPRNVTRGHVGSLRTGPPRRGHLGAHRHSVGTGPPPHRPTTPGRPSGTAHRSHEKPPRSRRPPQVPPGELGFCARTFSALVGAGRRRALVTVRSLTPRADASCGTSSGSG